MSSGSIKYIPEGFKTFTTNCGIKDKSLDLGVVYSEVICQAAAMFTKNAVKGNPVLLGMEHIKDGLLQAVLVNSKNANVFSGPQGFERSVKTCEKLANELGIKKELILPSSTGVIGREFPADKIIDGLSGIRLKSGSTADFADFARAIMTTDTFPKFVSRKTGKASLVGVAKGSGMIEPDMATMLSYFFTDADFSSGQLRTMLKKIVPKTFNSLSVDTDTSTSDTIAVLANGKAGKVDKNEFTAAFEDAAVELTRMLARDGEGATKLFIVRVCNAIDGEQAVKIGKSIINSPLVKTAIYKGDPNWGRIFMAIGKTFDERLKPENIKIRWGTPPREYGFDEIKELSAYLVQNEELNLEIDLSLGDSEWTVYGCDLTEEYVKINAYYTT